MVSKVSYFSFDMKAKDKPLNSTKSFLCLSAPSLAPARSSKNIFFLHSLSYI